MKNLNKAVFITGAGSGIGFQCAKTLSALGYTVYGTVLNEQEYKNSIENIPKNFHPFIMNILNQDDIQNGLCCTKIYNLKHSPTHSNLSYNSGMRSA